ncbi:polysaccharide deacetylase [Clostridium sp. Sa3CUN1]|uniref:Polysaccharide deacetylase n=1 Tax=Clostridium gallinarum TaxID=2762246 RepID=A0ABR8Q3Y9_9CLOT|nr:polysaccharide deacetylase family protein [Clostridium gallinarum]MBD7915136.1 polysaccharide deacetylase [Clostridium gallinarum]
MIAKEVKRRIKKIRMIRKSIIFIISIIVSMTIIFQFFDRLNKCNGEAYKKVEVLTSNNKEINEKIEEDISTVENSGYIRLEDDINADDVSDILPKTMYKWNFYREDNRKIAYLTFDDGPSKHSTDKILDILKKNNIKATFFVLGSSIENNNNSSEILKRIAKEGHAIGSHGYSHNYSKLYPNRIVDVKAVIEDFQKNDMLLKEVLGKDFSTRLIRLPGGHSSWKGTEALDNVLNEMGIWQVDWNALNGDAEGIDFPKDVLLENLKETVGDKDIAIILMHDTDNKKGTVEYLQSAIDYLKSQGFEFRTLK